MSGRLSLRSLGRAITSTVMLVGLLASVPASSPASAETAGAWTITTVAGAGDYGFSGDGGPAISAQLALPLSVAADDQGNRYIADTQNQRIRKVDSFGVITTVAGDGTTGSCDRFELGCDPHAAPEDIGDGGPATQAKLKSPVGIAVDDAGNVYVAESQGNRIRKVDTSGVITTVAGDGTTGRCDPWGDPACDPFAPPALGDGGPATSAHLNNPQSVDVDSDGNLYIADWANHRIRKVDTSGVITTVAGDGTTGRAVCDWFDPECDHQAPVTDVGDGGPAPSAHLDHPYDMTTDAAGNLYIADSGHARVRKVDTSGVITTVAGPGTVGHPVGVAVQGSGNLFVSDRHVIRRVDAGGTIDTVAGMGSPGFLGDGGYGPFALLRQAHGLDIDAAGNLYIADAENHRIRRLQTSYLWIDSSPEPTKVGETFAYDVSLSGLPATANGVTLTAALAPEVGLAGVTASQGSCSVSENSVSCQLGTLEPGATASVKITANAVGAGIIPVTATVGADDPGDIPDPRSVTGYTRISARDCGMVVTASTRLRADLGPCADDGIMVGADNVTLNLGGRRVFGFPGPSDGNAAGIHVPQRSHVQVLNGTVSDFDAGVFLNGGTSNTVANVTVRDNVGPDDPFGAELGDGIVLFDSASNRIVNNVITNNGIYDGVGVLGGDADDNVIVANTIIGNVGPGDGGPAGQGIIVNAAGLGVNDGQVITGTRIENNVVRGSGSAGIANINNVDAEIVGNTVEGNGLTNAQGNGIGVQLGPSRVAQEAATRVLVKENEVHGNGEDGIHVRRGAGGNRIVDNNASDNAALAYPWFRHVDLRDYNTACGDNVWSGNTWGGAFYSPACTATGGSGPTLEPEPEVYGEPSCRDSFDNDLDGLVDRDDPDCQPTEGPDAGPGSCSDGLDNDGDGLVDRNDPDCGGGGGRIRLDSAGTTDSTASATAESGTVEGEQLEEETGPAPAAEEHRRRKAEARAREFPPTRRVPSIAGR